MGIIKNKITTRLALEIAENFVFAYFKAAWVAAFVTVSFFFLIESYSKNTADISSVVFAILATPFIGIFYATLTFSFSVVVAYPSLLAGYITSVIFIALNVRSLWVWVFCSLFIAIANALWLVGLSLSDLLNASLSFTVAGLACGYLMWKSALKFMS